jgi:hypothetical protein
MPASALSKPTSISSALSVVHELTMINSNVIHGRAFDFLVSTLFVHIIHVPIDTKGSYRGIQPTNPSGLVSRIPVLGEY